MTTICIILNTTPVNKPLVATFMLDTKSKEDSHRALDWWEHHNPRIIPTMMVHILDSLKKGMNYVSDSIQEGTGFETKYTLPDATVQCQIIIP